MWKNKRLHLRRRNVDDSLTSSFVPQIWTASSKQTHLAELDDRRSGSEPTGVTVIPQTQGTDDWACCLDVNGVVGAWLEGGVNKKETHPLWRKVSLWKLEWVSCCQVRTAFQPRICHPLSLQARRVHTLTFLRCLVWLSWQNTAALAKVFVVPLSHYEQVQG